MCWVAEEQKAEELVLAGWQMLAEELMLVEKKELVER